MTIRMHTVLILPLVALLAACATPTFDPLEEARTQYQEAAGDPVVTQNAPVALYEAEKTLQKAEDAWEHENPDRAEHYAYLTKRRVELARARAQAEQAKQQAQQLAGQRDEILMSARTRELQQARLETREALTAVEQARLEADQARSELERSRTRAEDLERQMAGIEAEQTSRGTVLTLGGDVLFEFAKSDIKPGARQNLDRVVQYLEEFPDRQLRIEGHTDAIGPEPYNEELSRRRAQSVRTYLVNQGVDPQRIVTEGYGEQYPVAPNESSAGRLQNRRVEIVMLEPGRAARTAGRETERATTPPVAAGPPTQQEGAEEEQGSMQRQGEDSQQQGQEPMQRQERSATPEGEAQQQGVLQEEGSAQEGSADTPQ